MENFEYKTCIKCNKEFIVKKEREIEKYVCDQCSFLYRLNPKKLRVGDLIRVKTIQEIEKDFRKTTRGNKTVFEIKENNFISEEKLKEIENKYFIVPPEDEKIRNIEDLDKLENYNYKIKLPFPKEIIKLVTPKEKFPTGEIFLRLYQQNKSFKIKMNKMKNNLPGLSSVEGIWKSVII